MEDSKDLISRRKAFEYFVTCHRWTKVIRQAVAELNCEKS